MLGADRKLLVDIYAIVIIKASVHEILIYPLFKRKRVACPIINIANWNFPSDKEEDIVVFYLKPCRILKIIFMVSDGIELMSIL